MTIALVERGKTKTKQRRFYTVPGVVAVSIGMSATPTVQAVDGCLVMLCFAAPNWRSVQQCVSPMKEVLQDMARGRPFPVCAMASPGNAASHAWAHDPSSCPPQYVRSVDGESGRTYFCQYSGAISVSIDGALFSRTWWATDGDTVTEFSPAAKAQLGTWDSRFEDEYAAWVAFALPSKPPALSSH